MLPVRRDEQRNLGEDMSTGGVWSGTYLRASKKATIQETNGMRGSRAQGRWQVVMDEASQAGIASVQSGLQRAGCGRPRERGWESLPVAFCRWCSSFVWQPLAIDAGAALGGGYEWSGARRRPVRAARMSRIRPEAAPQEKARDMQRSYFQGVASLGQSRTRRSSTPHTTHHTPRQAGYEEGGRTSFRHHYHLRLMR